MTIQFEGPRAMHPEGPVRFKADVAELVGRVFLPEGQPKAVAVLHGATGVPARYYHPFAKWLTGHGLACLTYDYRDFGASAESPVNRSDATLVDWGLRDQQAAQVWLEDAFPGLPVWVIGHSIGGMMLPFQSGAARVSRLITVASGPVHLSDHPLRMKLGAAAFWYGPGPVAVAVMGKLPGRVVGISRDLPAGVYWQWRRWCTTRGFHLGDVGKTLPVPDFKAFVGEARIVAVADDTMVPPSAVWRLMQLYPNAWKRQHVIQPNGSPIGHIAAFHERNAGCWPEIIGTTPGQQTLPVDTA